MTSERGPDSPTLGPRQGTAADEEPDLGDRIEIFSKGAAALSLICYVLGLVTVNAWLFRLGVSEFSAINPRFIYTGAVMLALISASILCYFAAVKGAIDKKYVRLCLLAVPPVGFAFLLGTQGPPLQPADDVIREAVYVSVSIGGLLFAMAIAWSYLISPKPQDKGMSGMIATVVKPIPALILQAAVLTVVFLAAFGVVLAMLGRYVYPEIPEQFGGGQAKRAYLVVKTDGVADMKELGITMEKPHLTNQLFLLFETENSYVVRISGDPEVNKQVGRVVLVSKDLVEAVAFDRFLR